MERMESFVRLHIFLLVFPFSGFGQGLFENAGATDSSANAKPSYSPDFAINGFVKAGLYGGQADNDEAEMKVGNGQLSLKISANKADFARAFADLRMETGFLGGKEVKKIAVREAWVQTSIGSWDFKAGQQIIVWGRADGINPTNIITPCDPLVFSSEIDDQRLGNILIQSSFGWKQFRLEGIWVPVFKPDVLPLDDTALPGGIRIDTPNYPRNAAKNGSFALRVNADASQIDGSFSYYNGYAIMPSFKYSLNETGIHLIPTAYRLQAIGGDFSTTLGSYGIRGEAAFKKTVDDYKKAAYLPNPNLEYVVGIDKTIGDFSLLMQYAGKYVINFEKQNVPVLVDPNDSNAVMSYRRAMADYQMTHLARLLLQQPDEISHSITARIGWATLHETLKLDLSGIYNFITEEYVIRPTLTYDITDAVTVSMGAQYIDGPSESLYGIESNLLSNVFTELKLSF